MTHEIGHAVFHEFIGKDNKVRSTIRSMMDFVEAKHAEDIAKEGERGRFYGMQDEHEFVSEAFRPA